MASSFERVRQQTGDVAGASWSNMSSRHTELTRVNNSPGLTGTAEGELDSLFLRRYQSANLTGPRQSMVFSGTKRRTRRPLKPPFERDIRIDGGHGGSRQMIIKTGSDFLIGPVAEMNGLVDARGNKTQKRRPSNDRRLENKT